MKILFVISRFEIGGIVAFVDNLCSQFGKKGIECSVFGAQETDFPWNEYFKAPRVKKYFFKITANQRWQKELQLIFGSFFLFNKVAKSEKPHLIVFNHPGPAIGILLSPLSWRIPSVFHFHGAWDLEEKAGYELPSGVKEETILADWKLTKLEVRLALYYLMESIVARRVRKIFVMSPASKKLILDHFGVGREKIVIAPPGIDTQKFLPKSPRRTDKDEPAVLYLGRFDKKKGLDNLLFAASALAKRGLDFKLVLAGPIDRWGRAEALKKLSGQLGLGSKVKFLPAVVGEGKKKLLKAADLFVLSSTGFEAYPQVLMEALASGLPLIATPVGGVPDILDRLDKRLLTLGQDPEKLAEKLEWFLRLGQAEKQALSQKCISFARKHFDLSKRSTAILRAYKKVLE